MYVCVIQIGNVPIKIILLGCPVLLVVQEISYISYDRCC